ncbi:MAG TPA: IS1595 family transposase [Terracidiphilus sp.]|jgi:transposase-like protein
MGILDPQYQSEDAARAYLESILWPDGPQCPGCGVINEATKLQREEGTDTHGRKGLYQCKGCRRQFTITVGTIFEDSHIPLHKWLMAIHLMCSSKKGVSALQLQRELWGEQPAKGGEKKQLKGSYRTSWFMCHRIRWAMTQSPMVDALRKLSGTVEADETYVGGREKGKRGIPGAGSKKTPVLALLERGGDVRSFPIKRATLENIKPIIQQHVDPSSHLVTDEAALYFWTKDAVPQHHRINHHSGEYVRHEADFTVTTNTVESFFAILKRSNYGIYHHMSRKYLGSYCAERDFVYNGRKLTDTQRTDKAIKATIGRRLMLNRPKEG